MKLPASLFLACLATPAAAAPLGFQQCAEAEVTGHITHQDYEGLPSEPGTINMEGLIHIDFDVRHVRFGPLRKGPLRVETVAHTYLLGDRALALYLHRRKDKSWWIADCRNR